MPRMFPEYDTTPILPDPTVEVTVGMIEIAFMLLCGETELFQTEEGLVPVRMGPRETGLRLQFPMAESMTSHGS